MRFFRFTSVFSVVLFLLAIVQITSAATSFSTDFSLLASPDEMELSLPFGSPTVSFANGYFQLTSAAGSRQYLKTISADYWIYDFTFECTVTVPSSDPWAGGFIGMGYAQPYGLYGEPGHPNCGIVIFPSSFSTNIQTRDNDNSNYFGSTSDGVYSVRMTWTAETKQAVFQIDKNYNGNFVADSSITVDGSDNGFSNYTSSLYFGGGNGVKFDDINVTITGGGTPPVSTKRPKIYYFDSTYAGGYAMPQLYDHYHATVCVQGIVNRDAPRIFIKYNPSGEGGGDANWLNRLQESGGLCENWPTEVINGDVKNLINKFKSYIKGVVLYAPDTSGVCSTMVVATTVAGCEDSIAIRKDPSSGSLYNWLVNDTSGPRLPVIADLTGKFTGSGNIWDTSTPSTGSAKCDAYIWAKEKYLDTGKCDPSFISYSMDMYAMDCSGWVIDRLDYAIKRKAFCIDLSPWGDEAPNDDLTQPIGTDLNTFKSIMNTCNVLNGYNKMIKLIGFPNWDFKYTNFCSPCECIGGKHEPVETEWEFAKLISSYNCYLEATFGISNTSFYSGLMPEIKQRRYVQNPAPTYQSLVNRGIINSSDGRINDGHYIMLALGDYDGTSWVINNLANGYYGQPNSFWGDLNRGQIYASWAINPNLIDTIGPVFDYFYRTKTSKDYFMAWDSGAGYVNPGLLWENRYSGYPSIIPVWQEHCKDYYRMLDYSISGWLLDGWRSTKTTDCAYWAPFSGDGIGLDKANFGEPTLINNVPVRRLKSPYQPTASDINDDWSGGVDFDWYRTVLLSPTDIKNIEDQYAGYERNHRFLDPFSFYYLLRYKLSGYDQASNYYRVTWVDNTVPRILAAGQNYSVDVVVRNDGWDTWSANELYRLSYSIVPSGQSAGSFDARIDLPANTSVVPGGYATFSFNITAPSATGDYDIYFDIVKEGTTWFVGQNNIRWKQEMIVSTNETDIDTDNDGVPDVTEEADGTLWWHPDGDFSIPTGTIELEYGNLVVFTPQIRVALSATDEDSGVSLMRLKTGSTWGLWQPYAESKQVTFYDGYGAKTVYVQYQDAEGNLSDVYSDDVVYTFKGDFDGDSDVDLLDLELFVTQWLLACGNNNCNSVDLNKDGIVNFEDLAEMSSMW